MISLSKKDLLIFFYLDQNIIEVKEIVQKGIFAVYYSILKEVIIKSQNGTSFWDVFLILHFSKLCTLSSRQAIMLNLAAYSIAIMCMYSYYGRNKKA